MIIGDRWKAAVATLLLSGALLTGGAFAAAGPSSPMPAREHAGRPARLSEGQAEVFKQLAELRRSYKDKFRADAQQLIDQAVANGRITQQEADRLLEHAGKHGHRWHHRKGSHHGQIPQTKE